MSNRFKVYLKESKKYLKEETEFGHAAEEIEYLGAGIQEGIKTENTDNVGPKLYKALVKHAFGGNERKSVAFMRTLVKLFS